MQTVVNGVKPTNPTTFQVPRQLQIYRQGRRPRRGRVPARVERMERLAHRLLTPEAYDWVAGGAGRGDTIRANRDAFSGWQIVPRMLCDVSHRDFQPTLFGQRFPAPVLLAPVGVQDLVHPEGEIASARAAASLGMPFVLSTVASRSMEAVANVMGDAPRWFQLYWSRDPELTLSLIRRAERAGYSALVVTLDTQTLGWRERNLDLAYLPFLKGRGLANYVSDPVFRAGLPVGREDDPIAAGERYLAVFSNLSHTWADLRLIREATRLPLLLKGIQHPDDARRALDAGADGLIVSNHGGRQVDGGIATLDALPGVVAAVAQRVPVLMDGGIRRGADVFKAIALGAASVLVGRPYLWALTLGGEQGVRDYLLNLLADIDLTCALCGKSRLDDIQLADLVPACGR